MFAVVAVAVCSSLWLCAAQSVTTSENGTLDSNAGSEGAKASQAWTAHKSFNEVYFYNSETDESTWDRPEGLALEGEPIDDDAIFPLLSDKAPLVTLQQSTDLLFRAGVHKAWEPFDEETLTLVLQCDIKRLESGKLNRLANAWKGPISVAVLTKASDQDRVQTYLADKASDNVRCWADVHVAVAEKKWKHYPINKMRNFALDAARTKYVFILDIDEVLPFSMNEVWAQMLKARTNFPDRTAFAVRSFQTSEDSVDSPSSLNDLRKLYSQGKASVKHAYYPPAYTVPGYDFWSWQTLESAKSVDYRDNFEPYMIAKKSVLPAFDDRFVGFGRNKVVHALTLAFEGFQFVVLPKLFTWEDTRPGKAKERTAPNPKLIRDAWAELGRKYGCSKCSITHCARNCIGDYGKQKASLVQTALAPSL